MTKKIDTSKKREASASSKPAKPATKPAAGRAGGQKVVTKKPVPDPGALARGERPAKAKA